jgi:hypothetical protein
MFLLACSFPIKTRDFSFPRWLFNKMFCYLAYTFYCLYTAVLFNTTAVFNTRVPAFQLDNRPKLDSSLVESGSMMRGAIPVLPVPLAWFCLLCNIFVPGLGNKYQSWTKLHFDLEIPYFLPHKTLQVKGAPKRGDCRAAAPPPPNRNLPLRFTFTWFTLQPKSADD